MFYYFSHVVMLMLLLRRSIPKAQWTEEGVGVMHGVPDANALTPVLGAAGTTNPSPGSACHETVSLSALYSLFPTCRSIHWSSCIQQWEPVKNVTLYNQGLSLGDLGLGTQSVRDPELSMEMTVSHPTNASLT